MTRPAHDTRPTVLDIETAPDMELVEAALAKQPTFEAPRNYKDPDKIADNIAEQATKWRLDQLAKAGLTPLRGRVVCYGLRWGDESEETIVQTVPSDEGELLLALADHLARLPKIVTFNGLDFDAPFLRIRMLRHGITIPSCLFPNKRYTNIPHCDVRMILTEWDRRAEGTLDVWADLLLPEVPHHVLHPKTKRPVTGADVAGLVADGDFATVAAHCERDLIVTHDLFNVLADAGLTYTES